MCLTNFLAIFHLYKTAANMKFVNVHVSEFRSIEMQIEFEWLAKYFIIFDLPRF